MLIYTLLCIICELCGIGIIKILRIPLPKSLHIFIGPIITIAFWALCIGTSAAVCVPMKVACIPISLLTIVICIVGIYRNALWEIINEWKFIVIILFSAIFVTFGYFIYNNRLFPGSPFLDGWSYIAYGQYFWEYPRCTDGGLSPLYQYAAHLCHTRFISPGLLCLFSLLVAQPGDTQITVGYLLPLAFFVYASAATFFILTTKLKRQSQYLYIIFVVVSGWSLNLIKANNFDNILAMGFLPALVGIIRFIRFPQLTWGILLSIIFSGLIYIYPEMSFLIIFISSFYILYQFCLTHRRDEIKKWILLGITTITITILFSSPHLKETIGFFKNQFLYSLNTTGVKPGGDIGKELLLRNIQGFAFWGISSFLKFPSHIIIVLSLLISLQFSLLIYGFIFVFRKRDWATISAMAFLSTLLFYMVFKQQYAYGAYKIILLTWWLIAYLFFTAYENIINISMDFFKHHYRIINLVVNCGLIGFFLLVIMQFYFFYTTLPEKSILPFKQVKVIHSIIGRQPVLVNVSDVVANTWAMYYLRDIPIYLYPYKGYAAQAHVIPFMDRALKVDLSNIHYVLTDSSVTLPEGLTMLIWQGLRYKLWRIEVKNWAVLVDIHNPNGIETWEQQIGIWMGDTETSFFVIAPRDINAFLVGEFFVGPSISNPKSCRVNIINTKNGHLSEVTILSDGQRSIMIPLKSGINKIILRVTTKSNIVTPLNGDRRRLLLGVRNPHIVLTNE